MKEIKIGLLGSGTVGSGVITVLQMNKETIEQRIGAKLTLEKILVRPEDMTRPILKGLPTTFELNDILNDPSIEIVIELIGGTKVAKDFLLRAMDAGKHVVTANKDVIAQFGEEVFAAADRNHIHFMFEASVGGGIPIIMPLKRCLTANKLTEVLGIVNGTTNYIADDNTTVYTASLTGTTLSLSEVDDKFIPAGNAVILKSEGVPELTATPAAGTDFTGNDLQGSDTPVVQDDAYAYYALAYIDGKLAFCQVGPDVVIPAGKAYLTVPSAGAPARWFFEYADSDTATKIAGVNKAQNETGAIYTLQGQRVSAPAKSGVYIVGGKKVFIR